MKRVVLLFAVLGVVAVPAGSATANVPPPHCDPAACPNPVEGVQDCLRNLAIGNLLQAPPQLNCRPLGN